MKETRDERLGPFSRKRLWGSTDTEKFPPLVGRSSLVVRQPPEAALATINRLYALTPLTEDEVDLRQMALANDRVDRMWERFSPYFLERLAATLPGKCVLMHHQKGADPIGRFYAARLETDAGGTTWLMADYYLVKTEANAELRRQLDAGVIAYVSIGFRGGELVCDECRGAFAADCGHMPGTLLKEPGGERPITFTWTDPYGDCEAVEGSLVWLGAQYDARHVKSLSGACDADGDQPQRHKGHEKCPSCLRGSSAEAQALAVDGELYRADLIAEIRRLARLVDAEREAATLASALLPLGAAHLKELKSEYERRVDQKFPPRPFGDTADSRQPSTVSRQSPLAHRVL